MAAASSTASPQLLAANERLLTLRASAQQKRAADAVTSPTPADGSSRSAECAAALPDHLGWGSAALTRVMRRAVARHDAPPDGRGGFETRPYGTPVSPPDAALPNGAPPVGRGGFETRPYGAPVSPPDSVTLHPSIATAMLRHDLAAAGRIWLLLRAIDRAGRGWLAVEEAHALLTGKDAPLHVCGRRQLRNLLRQGQGVFWQRDSERIWLRSAAKVAAALGVARLAGRPVDLPVRVLLDGIGAVRAHFYASFHSGRRSNNPISRGTLAQLTAVPQRTQRAYDKAAGVASRPNYTVGDPLRTGDSIKEERAWQHGHATFEFTDHKGSHGKAGQRYIAWQLPNSYTGCHKPHVTGRTKRINRTLKDLVNQRGQGNSGERVMRMFYPNAVAAVNRRGGFETRPLSRRTRGHVRGKKGGFETRPYWRGAHGWWYVLAG